MLQMDQLKKIRIYIFMFFGVIWVQFWLGITINSESNIFPPGGTISGLALSSYYTARSIPIIAHMAIGILLLLISIRVFLLSMEGGFYALRIASASGLACVAIAIIGGTVYLFVGQELVYNIAMTMAALTSVLIYSVAIYYTGVLEIANDSTRI